MRISDWSSDVCSSDLLGETATKRRATPHRRHVAQQHRHAAGVGRDGYVFEVRAALQVAFAAHHQLGFALFDHRATVGTVRTADGIDQLLHGDATRSEEHTSELQSLMRISYAVF